jgi:hypothetical protein
MNYDDDYYYPQPEIWQECTSSRIKMDTVIIDDHDMDDFGKRIVTYLCSKCGGVHTSHIVVPR